MFFDYSPVGGVGIQLTKEMVERLISNGKFSEDDWEDDPDGCIDELGMSYQTAGNSYSDETYHYLLVEGSTLMEINENVDDFVSELSKNGITISKEEIHVIRDLHVW